MKVGRAPLADEALTLRDAVDAVGRWASRMGFPLFVGNGFLPRQVAESHDRAANLYLMGGMGLALPVALGFLNSRVADRPAVVLEGDGNFYMGVAAALYCGRLRANVVHVVIENGVYESSGGQEIPCSRPDDASDFARALGYEWGDAVDTRVRLQHVLDDCLGKRLPALVFVATGVGGPIAPRIDLSPEQVASRFRSWAVPETESV